MTKPIFPARHSRAALLGATAGLALAIASPAAAQCVVEVGGTATCSGDNMNEQVVSNGGAITVTTQPGFKIDSPANGLVISGAGSLTYDDANASTIIGRGRDGIAVGNGGGSSRVLIRTAGDVTGGGRAGIILNNLGTGGVRVEATGTVTGASTGITAVALPGSNGDIDILSNNASGGVSGIGVENRGGTGAIRITSTGTVSATDGEGFAILGFHSTAGAGGDIVIQANDVRGVGGGINVNNRGTGSIDITIDGTLEVTGRQGISAGNDPTAGDMIVTTRGTVTAGASAITVNNLGRGRTLITALGQVTSNNVRPQDAEVSGNGINVVTGLGAGEVVVAAAGVEGRAGILIRNSGAGSISLSATGLVKGRDGRGVEIAAGATTGDIGVRLAAVEGATDGILINALGDSAIDLVATGTLTGASGDGLSVSGAGPILLDVNNASGSDYGISIQTRDRNGATVMVRGFVEGGIAAIDAVADNGGGFTLTNMGTIRNRSGASADLAIQTVGGPVEIFNNGNLLGTIRLDAGIVLPEPEPENPPEDQRALSARSAFVIAEVPDVEASHRFTNAGTWNSIGGVNVFGGADDVLINVAGGRLIGGASAGTAETTTYSGLETLVNGGMITMVDGGFGDIVRTSGDAVFAAGSILAVDAGGSGSDRFVADGATTIDTGARLQISNPQPLALGTRYTVLESAGGVTGSFTFDDELLSAFLGYRQGSTPTTIFVEMTRLRAFAAAGLTANQVAVGAALDGQAVTDPLAVAALLLPTDAAAQAAFDGLSGEVHPAVRTAMVDDTRLPRNAVLERLRTPDGGAVWGQMFGNWGENDGKSGTADLDRDTIGGVLGADFGFGGNAVVGIAGAYLETDLTLAARASEAKLKSFHILGYAGGHFGGVSLKVGGGYAGYDIDTDRVTAFPGTGQRLIGAYDGSVVHGFAEVSYRVALGGGHVEPFAQIAAIRATTDGFAETGGNAALTGAKAKEKAAASTLGFRFETASVGAFSVAGSAGWQHGFGTLEPVSELRFATGPAFSILAAGQSRNAGVAAIEARFRPSERISVGVGYDGVIGSAGQDHSIKVGLRIAF